MSKATRSSVKTSEVREEITKIIKASRPHLIRESVLTNIITRKGYTIGNIRAVYNSYRGRSGNVAIPYVQAVRIGGGVYYRYSYIRDTSFADIKNTVLEKLKKEDFGLLIGKEDKPIYVKTVEQARLLKSYGINISKNHQSEMYISLILHIQDVLYKLVEANIEHRIPIQIFIETLQRSSQAIRSLDKEDLRYMVEFVLGIEPHVILHRGVIVSAVRSDEETNSSHTSVYSETVALERSLATLLQNIKNLSARAISEQDRDAINILYSMSGIERELMAYFYNKHQNNRNQ